MLQVELSVWKPYFYFLLSKVFILLICDLFTPHPPTYPPLQVQKDAIEKCNWINISVQKTFVTMPHSVKMYLEGGMCQVLLSFICLYPPPPAPPSHPEHLLKCVLVWTQSTSSLNTHCASLLVQKNNAGVVAYITVRPQCYGRDKWSLKKKKKKKKKTDHKWSLKFD